MAISDHDCILVLDFRSSLGYAGLYGIYIRHRNEYHCKRLPRNSIAESTSFYIAEQSAEISDQRKKHPGHQFVGICPAQNDVHARMSSLETFHIQPERNIASRRNLFFLVFEYSLDIKTAGAADIQFAFSLGVKIDKDVALEKTRLKSPCPCHSCFLVYCEEHFHRAVYKIFRFKNGHCHRNAETVVRSESGTVGTHPVPVNTGLYRIFFKIMHLVGILLRNHVYVGLEDYTHTVLHTRSRWFSDDYIAYLVLVSVKAEAFTEIVQELDRLAFFL